MLQILQTIVPIFVIILLGALIRFRGFLTGNVIDALNRLVYYIAIPAMIFKAVVSASFHAHFDPKLLIGTLLPLVIIFLLAILIGKILSIPSSEMGSFLQVSFHSNLGYIGFAVVFYFLGEAGLTRASILGGFIMLLQNFLSVLGYQIYSQGRGGVSRVWYVFSSLLGNPIILSALAGIILSLSGISLHSIIDKSLEIMSGMALPLALLVIGASLSFGIIRSHLWLVLGAGLLKLVALPALGYLFYHLEGFESAAFLPGLILLASPTATVSYVMATQMKGSPHLATGAITLSTLFSLATYTLWLSLSL